MNNKLTDIGFVSKAHGFEGEVFCVFNDDTELGDDMRFLFINLEGKPVPFFVERRKEKNGGTVIKFEDVNSEASAKKLAGLRLMIESDLAVNEQRDWDWHDLPGYEVTDKQFGLLGNILSIDEYPGQFVARCSVKNKEVLFPLSEDFILEINEDKRTLMVDLPEGLLDIYLDEENDN